jgi:aryl-alcohol dehydrogenase-like predicted oxidoreductase
MSNIDQSGTFRLGTRTVRRLGYGAMQLAGPGVFGPPKDPDAARAVLRSAVAGGVNQIDTSDFYGPHVTNQLIREALHTYPDDLVIVTKIGARRGADGAWLPAISPAELTSAVHDNLRNLGLDVLDVVNMRSMFGHGSPAEGSMEPQLTAVAELQRKGLVRHIGISNVTPTQIAEARRICEIVCVQNHYNLAHPRRNSVCAVFPAWRVQSASVVCPIRCRSASWRHAHASRARLAAASRPEHPADPRHLVCRASAREPRSSRTGVAR